MNEAYWPCTATLLVGNEAYILMGSYTILRTGKDVLRTTEAGTLTWGWNTLRSWNSVQTAERCHEVMFGLGRLQTIFFNRISLTAIDKLGPPFLTE